MAEPIDMGKARNAYARERDIFRRELQWALHQFDHLPLTFDMKTELRFRAADLKAERLEAYRNATRDIESNQPVLQGNSLRVRSMANGEDSYRRDRLNRSKSPLAGRGSTDSKRTSLSKILGHPDDQDDVEEFIARNRASRGRYGKQDINVPISKFTYDAHRSVSTNTHVLAFEHQLRNDMDVMIASIESLSEHNRADWLKIPHSNRSQYFSSRYDDTSFSVNSYLPPPSLGSSAAKSSLSSASSQYSISRPGGVSNLTTTSVIPSVAATDERFRASDYTPKTNTQCSVQNYYDRYLEGFDKSLLERKKPVELPAETRHFLSALDSLSVTDATTNSGAGGSLRPFERAKSPTPSPTFGISSVVATDRDTPTATDAFDN